MRFVEIDSCPVPARLGPVVIAIKNKSGETLVSCYRGSDPNGVRILRANGKMSQKELYEGFVEGRPGFNPANRPGQSTHELRSDGVAYRGPVGRRLLSWQVGMDWTRAHEVVEVARRFGFTATITYPNNPKEQHHVNFRRAPRIVTSIRSLRRGSTGARVKLLTKRLMIARSPFDGSPYLDEPSNTFTERVETAVKEFQRHHHQRQDGVVGAATQRQLMASVRFQVHKER